MRQVQRLILLALLVICNITSNAIDVTFPTSFEGGWESFIGQTVTFTNDFYICDFSGTKALYLSHRRLRAPEENALGLAQGDSTAYFAIQAANQKDLIRLWGISDLDLNAIRKGARITGLTAQVSEPQSMSLVGKLTIKDLDFPTQLPDMNNPRLLICATNIEHYWTTLGEMGAQTAEQLARQTQKIATGLVHINADIYAICELQEGTAAISQLTNKMNALAGDARYAYVDNEFNEYNSDMVGFIYRQDKVEPYGKLYFPYYSYGSAYHYRMIIKGWREKATKQQFAISLNHTKSKAGDGNSDPIRMENVRRLHDAIRTILNDNIYSDPDILLVGDYNAYSQEQPNRYLVDSAQLVDQTLLFDSLNYSYAYGSEVGYLDRVFSTPSMTEQITAIHPYHINTDYHKNHEYKYGEDVSMCRYSDHDPILIGLNLFGETAVETVDNNAHNEVRKVLRNGQIYILIRDEVYTLYGTKLNH